MPAQPTNHSQNIGLVVIVIGIFMVIVSFVAVTYLNGSKIDTVKTNQKVGAAERGDLTDITCALWRSIGDPAKVEPTLRASVEAVCSGVSASPTP